MFQPLVGVLQYKHYKSLYSVFFQEFWTIILSGYYPIKKSLFQPGLTQALTLVNIQPTELKANMLSLRDTLRGQTARSIDLCGLLTKL